MAALHLARQLQHLQPLQARLISCSHPLQRRGVVLRPTRLDASRYEGPLQVADAQSGSEERGQFQEQLLLVQAREEELVGEDLGRGHFAEHGAAAGHGEVQLEQQGNGRRKL